MGAAWTSLASGAPTSAAGFFMDMLPVLALLAGIGLAERVIRFVIYTVRG